MRTTPHSQAAHRRGGWLFLLLDGRDPSDRIWRTLRPDADIRPVHTTEDNS